MSIYTEDQRALQQRFATVPLADLLEAAIVANTITEDQQAFIESRDFFFLSTVNTDGRSTNP